MSEQTDKLSVYFQATTGDRRRTLEALRDKIAQEIDLETTPARDLASLARQLASILAELERLPSGRVNPVNELAKRRNERRTGT